MVSLAARGGISTMAIIDQLHSTGVCSSYAVRTATKKDTSRGSSCCSGIAYAIEKMYKEVLSEINEDEYEIETNKVEIVTEKKENKPKLVSNKKCPECGEQLTNQSGCIQCTCGWSQCG